MKTVSRQRFSLWLILVLVGFLVVVLLLPGCSSIQKSERTYAASYDADEQRGTISITLRPVTPTAQVIQRTTDLDEKQIAELIKKVMEQNRFPDVTKTPELK